MTKVVLIAQNHDLEIAIDLPEIPQIGHTFSYNFEVSLEVKHVHWSYDEEQKLEILIYMETDTSCANSCSLLDANEVLRRYGYKEM